MYSNQVPKTHFSTSQTSPAVNSYANSFMLITLLVIIIKIIFFDFINVVMYQNTNRKKYSVILIRFSLVDVKTWDTYNRVTN